MDTQQLEPIPGFDIVEIVAEDAVTDDSSDDEVILQGDDEPDEPEEAPTTSRGATAQTTAAQLAAARREAAQYKAQLESAQNDQGWMRREREIESAYQSAKARIFELSNQAPEPNDFIDTELERLKAWRDGERDKRWLNREEGWKQRIVQLSVPNYVDELITQYGLKKADRQELLRFQDNIDKMEARAEFLAEKREKDSVIATNNRRAAERSSVAVRSGKGSGNVKRVKAGSDNHLLALLGEPLIPE